MPITFADVRLCNVVPVMKAIGKHGERRNPRGRCKVNMVSELDEVYEKVLCTNTENALDHKKKRRKYIKYDHPCGDGGRISLSLGYVPSEGQAEGQGEDV